jgi:hypothetical protein
MSGVASKRSLLSWAGSKDEGNDSRKKKHAGTSQKAQQGLDFSKLLVIFCFSTYDRMFSVLYVCVTEVIMYVWAGWGCLCAFRVCEP